MTAYIYNTLGIGLVGSNPLFIEHYVLDIAIIDSGQGVHIPSIDNTWFPEHWAIVHS